MDERHPERPELRIADADRDRAAERLGFALSEGRIDMGEYERRLEQAMSAKTAGELEPVMDDLPISAEEQRRAAAEREAERKQKDRRAYLDEWKTWIGAAVVMNGIWGVTSISSGEMNSYWPAIPLGIWAVVLLAGIFWKDDRNGGSGSRNRG